MKLILQRVKYAKVKVKNKIVGEIQKGFLVLLGIKQGDTTSEADYLVNKLCHLRIFEDEDSKMNLSLQEVEGKLLIVSQFTLYANCEKGNRPSFVKAAKPEQAEQLYEYFIERCKQKEIIVETGIFGAHMEIELINDGPVTIEMEK